MTSIAVSVSGLHKRYGRTVALDGVDLDLGPGVTGLLGPNGAGKTTFLRMVATVLAPDAGTIRLLGEDPSTAAGRHAIRTRLGYCPQEPGFYPGFTTFDFVDYVAILKEMTDRRARHDEVRRVLGLVGLDEVSGKKIRSLSGGMRRRVAVAQSLLGSPDLLVLDEPTAGLDPEQRLRFREILSRRDPDQAVVLSTHQTEDVAALCQRVVVLHGAKVHFDGTTASLAAVAHDRVWRAGGPDPAARVSWIDATGQYRHVGDPPAGADLVEPTIEDGYLLLVGAAAHASGVPEAEVA